MNKYWEHRSKLYKDKLGEAEQELLLLFLRIKDDVQADLDALYIEILESKEDGTILISDLYRYDRIYKLNESLSNHLHELEQKEQKIVETHLTNMYIENSKLLKEDTFFKVSVTKEDAKTAVATTWTDDGKHWSKRIWNNTQLLQQRITEGITKILITGNSRAELVKQLMNDFGVGYNVADRLVRTELSMAQNMSCYDTYIKNGIRYYRIIDTKDERCCEHCHELSKEIFPIEDKSHIPPKGTHVQCRCAISPVTKKENTNVK